jgi:hypothetical protein
VLTPRSDGQAQGTQRQRDPHCGPVPDAAWKRDAETRRTTGRVEIFNATRHGGLDGWTMDGEQYRAVHDLILDIIDDDADTDGTIRLQHVVDAIQHRLGNSELFPKGRLTVRGRRGFGVLASRRLSQRLSMFGFVDAAL